MSYVKRQLEDLAYMYLESHPERDVIEVMEDIVLGRVSEEEILEEC